MKKRVTFNKKCKLRTLRSAYGETASMLDAGTSSNSSLWYSGSELQDCRHDTAMLVKFVRQYGMSVIENCPHETFLGLEKYSTKKTFREHAKRKKAVNKKVLAEQAIHRNDWEDEGGSPEDIDLRIAFASLSVSKSSQLEARCRASRLRSEVLEWEGVESCPKNEEQVAAVATAFSEATKNDDSYMNFFMGGAVVNGETCLTAPPMRRRIAPGAA